MAVLLLKAPDLLLLSLQVGLQPIVLALEFINLVLELGHLRVPGRLFCLVSEKQLRLLGLSARGTALDFPLAVVKVLPLLLKLSLQFLHLLLLFGLKLLQLLLDAVVDLLLLLEPLVEVGVLVELVARGELEALGEVRLGLLELLDFGVQFGAVSGHSLLLFLEPLGVLRLQLLDHLRVRLLRVRLVVEVHLLLQLERLLEFLLQLFKVRLALVALRL